MESACLLSWRLNLYQHIFDIYRIKLLSWICHFVGFVSIFSDDHSLFLSKFINFIGITSFNKKCHPVRLRHFKKVSDATIPCTRHLVPNTSTSDTSHASITMEFAERYRSAWVLLLCRWCWEWLQLELVPSESGDTLKNFQETNKYATWHVISKEQLILCLIARDVFAGAAVCLQREGLYIRANEQHKLDLRLMSTFLAEAMPTPKNCRSDYSKHASAQCFNRQ